MPRNSQDEKVNEAGVRVNTGRKWKAEEAVKQAESRLRHSDSVGTATSGWQGLGLSPATRWCTANKSDRRELVQREVRQTEEETRQQKAKYE